MDIAAVQATKLKADRAVAEQKTATSLKNVGEARARENAASKKYASAVDKIISQLKGRNQNLSPISVTGLRQSRVALLTAKKAATEAKQVAQKQLLVLRKLSDKLETLDGIIAAKKKCEILKKASISDEEVSDIASARLVATAPLELGELVSKLKDGLALKEVSPQPVHEGPSATVPSEISEVTAIDPTPVQAPIYELQVTKNAPGEVAVGFKNIKGEQCTIAVSQAPNGSVSLSWHGYTAYSKEVIAIEGAVLSKLRQAGIRNEGRRRRGL